MNVEEQKQYLQQAKEELLRTVDEVETKTEQPKVPVLELNNNINKKNYQNKKHYRLLNTIMFFFININSMVK